MFSRNRDDGHFADAQRFDVRRANARTHLAFGQGVHSCIGAALARMKAKVGSEALLGRTRNIRLAKDGDAFRHTPSLILRGLRQLHIKFEPGLGRIVRGPFEISRYPIAGPENGPSML